MSWKDLIHAIVFSSRGIPLVSQDRNVRIDAISCVLSSGKYDLVSLQEVWSEDNYQTIRDKVKAVLPFSHYFYRYAREALLYIAVNHRHFVPVASSVPASASSPVTPS